MSRSSGPAVFQRRPQTPGPASGSWARGIEHDHDVWDSPPRRHKRQQHRRCGGLAVSTGASVNFAKLKGGTCRHRPNGGDHNWDVWYDVPGCSLVAASRAESVGDAACSRPLPLLHSSFPVLGLGPRTASIIFLRFSASIPAPSLSCSRPPSTSPIPPFTASQHPPHNFPAPHTTFLILGGAIVTSVYGRAPSV